MGRSRRVGAWRAQAFVMLVVCVALLAPVGASLSEAAYEELIASKRDHLEGAADRVLRARHAEEGSREAMVEAVREVRPGLARDREELGAVDPPAAYAEAHRHLLAAYDEGLAAADHAEACLGQRAALRCVSLAGALERARDEGRAFEEAYRDAREASAAAR